MKSLLIRMGVVVMVGLAIFSYAEVWGAECAWVLWMKSERYSFEKSGPKESQYWELLVACPHFEQCLDAQRQAYENKRKYYREIKAPGIKKAEAEPYTKGSLVLHIHLTFQDEKGEQTGFQILTFQCFPDTIDPRK